MDGIRLKRNFLAGFQVIISDVELGFDSASHLYLKLVDGGALNKALL